MVSLMLIGCAKAQALEKENNDRKRVIMNVSDVNYKKDSNKIIFKDLGFQFYVNDIYQKYIQNKMISFEKTDYPNEIRAYFITSDDIEKIMKEKVDMENTKPYRKDLFLIKVVDKNNDLLPSNVDELAKIYSKEQKIGEVNNFEYYLWYNDSFDTSKLSEQAKNEVKDMLEGFDFFKKNIELFN